MTLLHATIAGGSHSDHADVLRSGASEAVLGQRMMAPPTLGTFLRAFTFGHVRQLEGSSQGPSEQENCDERDGGQASAWSTSTATLSESTRTAYPPRRAIAETHRHLDTPNDISFFPAAEAGA